MCSGSSPPCLRRALSSGPSPDSSAAPPHRSPNCCNPLSRIQPSASAVANPCTPPHRPAPPPPSSNPSPPPQPKAIASASSLLQGSNQAAQSAVRMLLPTSNRFCDRSEEHTSELQS